MEQIWWERVPNALAFKTDITESLLNGRSIVLHSSGGFPWYDYLASRIREGVQEQNASKSFSKIFDVSTPGVYLLDEFCKAEKRASYRPVKSYAKFFAESDDIVLHETFFWVKVCSKEQLKAWVDFVSDYYKERNKKESMAVFIIEWIGLNDISPKKGITLYSLDDYVNDYDRIAFCTLAASTVKEKSFIKNYLMELAANVIGNDIELCAKCLENYIDFLQYPYAEIQSIVNSEIRSTGDGFVFENSETDVEHLIWLTQIRTVYPFLEEFREDFVRKYSDAISKQLPITSSYGEIYDNPKDVELGTLKFMADERRLYLSSTEYERLKIFKEARNNLSHLAVLSINEIRELGI